MDFLEEFEQVKAELREKWLDYYEANRSWIKIANLHKGQRWDEVIDGTDTTLWCPNSNLIIGFATGLDKRIANSIKISIHLSGSGNVDKIVEGLGLKFDPDIALKAREEYEDDEEDDDSSEDEEVEEEKVDDLGLDILRKEASQLMNDS